MKKLFAVTFLTLFTMRVYAETPCDIQPGASIGIKVVEFTSGNTIHSKILFREGSADAILEEMVNLQDMGVCEEKIISKRCILKFEKDNKTNVVTMYRGSMKWNTWGLNNKTQAQNYVKSLKRVGFCS